MKLFKLILVLFIASILVDALGKGLDSVLYNLFGDWYFFITIIIIAITLYVFKGEI